MNRVSMGFNWRPISLVLLGSILILCSTCTGFKRELEDSIAAKPTSTAAATADTTPPTQPSTPAAVSGGSNQIDLSWSAASDNTSIPSQISYEICQALVSGGCTTFTATYTIPAGQIVYSAIGLTALTPYYYVMRAKDAAGNFSTVSGEFSATTAAAGTVNNPTYSPVAGIYGSAQNITISTTTPAATICYTTDGVTTPACNAGAACIVGSTYGAAVSVPSTTTLQAIACKSTFTASAVVSGAFTIDTAPPTPGASGALSFTSNATAVDVSFTQATDNADAQANLTYLVYYSLSNNIGTVINAEANGTAFGTYAAYTSPIVVTGLSPITLYYFNVITKDTSGNKAVYTANSASTAAAGTVNNPSYSPVAGTYNGAQSVAISTTTPGATLCYTTNGSIPACNASAACTTGSTYATNVAITTSGTLKAIACLATYTPSTVASGAYLIDLAAPTAPLAPSVFSVAVNQINMSWGTSTDDTSTSGQISFEICQATVSGGCDTFTATYTTAAGVGMYSATGLTGYTTYYYRIRAKDFFGKTSVSTAEFSGKTDFWKLQNPTMQSAIYSAIAYGATGGNGTFVAVANASNTAYYSTDNGVTWSPSAPLPGGTQNWTSVAYGSAKFVAMCTGCNTAAYSADGINWTATGSLAGSLNWSAIARGSTRFVAVASGSTIGSYSTAGTTTWTNSTGLTTLAWSAITSNNTTTFVAVAAGSNTVGTSAGGITWATTGTIPGGPEQWSSVAYNGTRYVAIGNGVTAAAHASIPSGAWTLSATLPASGYTAVAAGGTTFVMVGNGNSAISTDNGLTWTALNVLAPTMTAIAYGNGKFVAISSNDTRAVTSP